MELTAGGLLRAAAFGSLAGLPLLFGCPEPARAQATLNPYASAEVEHDSNVFRLPNSQYAVLYNGNPRLADVDERYAAGITGDYLWGIQRLTGTVEGRQVEYDRFTYLNHSEYLGNLRLDWKLGTKIDGILQIRQERTAAAFESRDSSTLEINVDRNIVGKLNYYLTPDWRIETGANAHTLKAPLQFYPDFTEHETGSHLGVSYLGVANLAYGISFDHVDGNFTHAIGVGPYSQTSGQFQATYLVSGLSSFNGALGYTRRKQSEPEGTVSGITGNFGYNRKLTGKTSINLQLIRAVNSYVAAGGSEIDTTGSISVLWQTTYKLGVNVGYSYTKSNFVGDVIPGADAAGRADHTPNATLNLTYQLLKQLQLKAYANSQSRSSNYEIDRYSDTTYGIQAYAHWR